MREGQKIGEVGSSGRSGGPHLHIGEYDCDDKALDMMGASLFRSPPPYEPPRALMNARFSTKEDLSAPIFSSHDHELVYADFLFSVIRPGDRMSLNATPSAGQAFDLYFKSNGPRFNANFFWRPHFELHGASQWTLTIRVNDEVVDTRPWTVAPAR